MEVVIDRKGLKKIGASRPSAIGKSRSEARDQDIGVDLAISVSDQCLLSHDTRNSTNSISFKDNLSLSTDCIHGTSHVSDATILTDTEV